MTVYAVIWERGMSKSEWLPLMNNGEEKPMTDSKKQSLAILEKVYQHLSSLSDDELFDMMYKYSPNFKKQVNRIEENLKGITNGYKNT